MLFFSFFFFFNDTATTEIYTLSLHDALPILLRVATSAPPCGTGCEPPALVQVGVPCTGIKTTSPWSETVPMTTDPRIPSVPTGVRMSVWDVFTATPETKRNAPATTVIVFSETLSTGLYTERLMISVALGPTSR